VLRLLLVCLVVLPLSGCGGSSSTNKTTDKSKTKNANSSSNYRPPQASKARKAFNDGASRSLGGGFELSDLDSENEGIVSSAIESMREAKNKAALPKLEQLAKGHKSAEIRNKAKAAVSVIKAG
jgi:hypothetical protein